MAKSRGTFTLPNSLLRRENDFLYHLNIAPASDSFVERCQDVKFICTGGKNSRMQDFAEKMYENLGYPENSEFEEKSELIIPKDRKLKNISGGGGRFVMFKVGPILSASHGIGSASMSVAIHELLKLCHYAKCSDDLTMIRIGTCGGLGIDPGTAVITDTGYNGLLEPNFKQVACGKEIKYNSKSNTEVSNEIEAVAKSLNIKTVRGNTLTANDFYEEQGRLDGAMCSFTEEEKKLFLQTAFDKHGIVNMEMESACIIAMCNRAKVKCAVVCAVVINRLLGDSITEDITKLKSWELYPQQIVAEFIKKKLSIA